MKTFLLTLLAIIITGQLFAQSPHGFKYQAVVRDQSGTVLSEKAVSFRISIIQASTSGTVVYKEIFTTTTNTFGVVTLEIGSGSPITGIFESIEWSKDIYYLKIELDASGGTNYKLMGVSQLLSVPYALYAEKATYSISDHDTSATNELQTLSINNYKLTISKGNSINLPEGDSSATNELQKLTFFNDTLLLDQNGGYVYLGNYDNSKAINNLLLKVISDSTYIMNYTSSNLQNISYTAFQAINKEEVKRYVEDSLLRLKIKSDSTYLKSKINDNLLYIQGEQTIRLNADNALYIKLDSDSNYLKGRIDNTSTQLTQETTSRSNADNTLQSNVTTETNSRISGDNSIRNKMSSDSSVLRTIANTTNTNLTNEISSRIAGDNNQKSKQVSDSTYLKGLITTETNSRINGDNSIRSKMSTDSSSLRTILNTTTTNLTNETNTRIASDNNIKSKIISDSSFLKSIINSNTTNIATNTNALTTETTNRINRDIFILGKISADSTYLTNDVTNLTNNLQNNYYTKTNLQSSSGALVHFDNLTNRPTTLAGYGISDATPNSHIGATGSLAHGNASFTASGFMSASDKMKLDSISGYNTGNQTISTTGINTPTISLSANGGQFVLKGSGHTTLNHYSDTISISSTDTFTSYYAGTGITLSGTTFNTVWSNNGNDIYNNNSGNIGIGTSTPNSSSKLEINSTTQGFLPPRMTNSQMLAITNPLSGLTVYNSDEACPCWYNGSMWVCSKNDFKSCGKILYGGQTYNTLIIANKCWMKENINIGTLITGSINPSNNGLIEKYCYNNISDSCTIYGGLYTWEEAMGWAPSSNGIPSGVQGICPQGWHIPSNREWDTMEFSLYGVNYAGGYLKERSLRHWLTPNTGADNYSGFTALGAGNRTSGGGFSNYKTIAYYWSSTEISLTTTAKYHSVRYNLTTVTPSSFDKANGLSVRCVKD